MHICRNGSVSYTHLDPGIFTYAKEICPEIERHISTQANNTNYETYRFWYKLGAKRVVTARELSLEEIRQIRANIPDDMEIETFIHGAMCISYSGRCLLSNFLVGRDANQGSCTHPVSYTHLSLGLLVVCFTVLILPVGRIKVKVKKEKKWQQN